VSDEPTIDLPYIGHAMDRLITEVATSRDDMTVLTAMKASSRSGWAAIAGDATPIAGGFDRAVSS
jgi:hypothetical protein